MTGLRDKARALRDEHEKLARMAERRMLDPALSADEQRAAGDEAKVHWQISRNWADTLVDVERESPSKFTGRNKGPQAKTQARRQILEQVRAETGITKRQLLARAAWRDFPSVRDLFTNEDAVYRFIGRKKF